MDVDDFQNSCQVVPNCGENNNGNKEIPLTTPDFMSSQLSFEDIFYTPPVGGQQELLHTQQQQFCDPTLFQNEMKLENIATQSCMGQRSYSCESEQQMRKYSMGSEESSPISAGHIKTEPCSPHGDYFDQGTISQRSSEELEAETGDDIDTSLELYRDLILNHLVQDIKATCSKLGIPTGK